MVHVRARGIESPYLHSFVTARIHTERLAKTVTLGVNGLLDKMQRAAAAAGYAGDEE